MAVIDIISSTKLNVVSYLLSHCQWEDGHHHCRTTRLSPPPGHQHQVTSTTRSPLPDHHPHQVITTRSLPPLGYHTLQVTTPNTITTTFTILTGISTTITPASPWQYYHHLQTIIIFSMTTTRASSTAHVSTQDVVRNMTADLPQVCEHPPAFSLPCISPNWEGYFQVTEWFYFYLPSMEVINMKIIL